MLSQIDNQPVLEDIPGSASASQSQLQTHSLKFPVEHKVTLEQNKSALKIPLNTGTHHTQEQPFKNLQAWEQINQHYAYQLGNSSKSSNFPEDVTDLADRRIHNEDKIKEDSKRSVSKTYQAIKGIISSKFNKKDMSAECLDELNNSPNVLKPEYIKHMATSSHFRENSANFEISGLEQRHHHQLEKTNITDSDDGGFIKKIEAQRQQQHQTINEKKSISNDVDPYLESKNSQIIYQNNGFSKNNGSSLGNLRHDIPFSNSNNDTISAVNSHDIYNQSKKTKQSISPTKMYPSQLSNFGNSAKTAVDRSLMKRHLFGLDLDFTSTTTRSIDLESLIGLGQSVSDSEADAQGLKNIKNQLEGLENMYSEVLKMLKHRNPNFNGSGAEKTLLRKRYGSVSSLPSSSISNRPHRERKRVEEKKKLKEFKNTNKRFQRLESHVVTLARSVAHLSSEMRSQHLVTQELDMLKNELSALRLQISTRGKYENCYERNVLKDDSSFFADPKKVKKLTKFFGEDPPLLRLFLRRLGYEKYASVFEKEKIGMIELPYLTEEKLQKIGIPLGPRSRILQEAQISICKETTLCII